MNRGVKMSEDNKLLARLEATADKAVKKSEPDKVAENVTDVVPVSEQNSSEKGAARVSDNPASVDKTAGELMERLEKTAAGIAGIAKGVGNYVKNVSNHNVKKLTTEQKNTHMNSKRWTELPKEIQHAKVDRNIARAGTAVAGVTAGASLGGYQAFQKSKEPVVTDTMEQNKQTLETPKVAGEDLISRLEKTANVNVEVPHEDNLIARLEKTANEEEAPKKEDESKEEKPKEEAPKEEKPKDEAPKDENSNPSPNPSPSPSPAPATNPNPEPQLTGHATGAAIGAQATAPIGAALGALTGAAHANQNNSFGERFNLQPPAPAIQGGFGSKLKGGLKGMATVGLGAGAGAVAGAIPGSVIGGAIGSMFDGNTLNNHWQEQERQAIKEEMKAEMRSQMMMQTASEDDLMTRLEKTANFGNSFGAPAAGGASLHPSEIQQLQAEAEQEVMAEQAGAGIGAGVPPMAPQPGMIAPPVAEQPSGVPPMAPEQPGTEVPPVAEQGVEAPTMEAQSPVAQAAAVPEQAAPLEQPQEEEVPGENPRQGAGSISHAPAGADKTASEDLMARLEKSAGVVGKVKDTVGKALGKDFKPAKKALDTQNTPEALKANAPKVGVSKFRSNLENLDSKTNAAKADMKKAQKQVAIAGGGLAAVGGSAGLAVKKSKEEEKTASEVVEDIEKIASPDEEMMNGLYKEAAAYIMEVEFPEIKEHVDPMSRITFS